MTGGGTSSSPTRVLDDFDHAKRTTACDHPPGQPGHHHDGLDHTSCGSHLHAVTDDRLSAALEQHAAWSMREGRLRCRLDFPTFDDAMAFVVEVAQLSRDLNHHPDIHVENKRTVYLVLWTHKAQAITELDLQFVTALAGLEHFGRSPLTESAPR